MDWAMLRALEMVPILRKLATPAALAALVLVPQRLPGQGCDRPVPPGGVFGMRVEPTSTVTYSDGYATHANLLLPDAGVPGCRWPLVIFVHQLGGSRVAELALQQQIVAEGHAVWTYDVRGQGSGILLNPSHPNRGTSLWGAVEFADLAEQVQHVAANQAALVDPSRLAVVGISQGAAHAWRAAAWSGQSLSVPGRAVSAFPPVRCVVAADYVAESTEDWVRNGIQFSSWFVNVIADDAVPAWNLDPDFRTAAAQRFRAQDPQGLLQLWQQEDRPVLQRLLQSTVPVLFSHAYHDFIDGPMPALEVLERMPQGVGHRSLLSTVGHDTPRNEHEVRYRDREVVVWLQQHLWGEQPSVARSRHSLALLPVQGSVRDDQFSLWGRLETDSVRPLQQVQPVRLHLQPDGMLHPSQPVSTFDTVRQVVLEPTYDAANYLTHISEREVGTVLAHIPLSELVFETAPLQRARMLAAAPQLDLVVTPSHPVWAIAALLTVEAPGEPETMIASMGVARSNGVPNVAQPVSLRFPPVATQVPAGSVVRLRLRNHWLRAYPMSRTLEVAPLFHEYDVAVHFGGSAGSWLEMPWTDVLPTLLTDASEISVARPAPVQFTVRSDVELAGAPCVMTMGALGQHEVLLQAEGLLLPQQEGFLLQAQAWQLENGAGMPFGSLDPTGAMQAVLDLVPLTPLPPELAGLELEFRAHVAPTATATVRSSAPVRMRFR